MVGMKMSKAFLTPTVVHPNLGATSTEGMKGAYDVVIAKNEKFITPDGKKGRVRVFSRVNPERILDDKSGKLQAYADRAKSKISDAILKLKAPAEKKNKLIPQHQQPQIVLYAIPTGYRPPYIIRINFCFPKLYP